MKQEIPISGVIYPLFREIIDYMYRDNKDIFVKFVPHKHTKKSKNKLRTGMKIYFYQSKANKEIIGEATIMKIDYMYPSQILENYQGRLIIPPTDFKKYSKGRETKMAMVLELSKNIKYKKLVRLSIPLTMNGLYVRNNEEKLFIHD